MGIETAIIASAIGAGGALGSAALSRGGRKGGGGGGGIPGLAPRAEVVRLPTFDFTEPRFRQLSDFVQQQFESISRGEPPLFFQNQLPLIRRGFEEQLQQTFFGRPGERTGIIPATQQASAITGTGGASANRRVGRQLDRFSEQSRRIEEFIAAQTIGATQQSIRDVGTLGLNIPQGPPSQVAVLGGFAPQTQAPQAGPIGQLFGSLGQLAAGPVGDILENFLGNRSGNIDFSSLPSNLIGSQFNGQSVVGTRNFGLQPAASRVRDPFVPPASFLVPPSQF